MRRIQKAPEKVIENIGTVLYPTYQKDFVDPNWEIRKKEVLDLMNEKKKNASKDGEAMWKTYEVQANNLR